MKQKELKAYSEIVHSIASMSSCNLLKVGAILVKNNSIISYGYNGTPYGEDNQCECDEGLTKPEVIHAEHNMLLKCASSHNSSADATVVCTHSPCLRCAVYMYQAGIRDMYYVTEYKNTQGIEFLQKKGIRVEKIVDIVTE